MTDVASLIAAKSKAKKTVDVNKYKRMKKIGMPLNSILNRMKMDGCPAEMIAEFAGPAQQSSNTNKKSNDDEELIMPNISISAKMKPFHWAKLSKAQTENTIFDGVSKQISSFKLDFEEIQELFENAKSTGNSNSNSNSNSSSKSSSKKDHSLIDPKRSQNVLIGLAQMKMSDDQLLDAILSMDDKKLPTEKLRKLLPYVPTDGELQMVRDYVKNGGNVNNLSKVEQFFVKMMDLVGIRERIALWVFKSEFPKIIKVVKERLTMVSDTMTAIMSSARLRTVFACILALGNCLNHNSSRGNAYGFYLEPTLELLNGMKATDKKTSLMVYLAQTVRNIDADAWNWVDELQIISDASRIKTNSVLQDLDAIKRDMRSIDKHLKAQRRTMTKTHSEWVASGAAVSLNQLARHIRKASKSLPKQQLALELETYPTLKAGMGMPGKIMPSYMMNKAGAGKVGVPSIADVALADGSDDESENMFGKVMLLFYKRSNSKVTDVETQLKTTQMQAKKMAAFFGFEESKKWEEMLVIFDAFLQNFVKAQREISIRDQKDHRKEMQNEKRNALANKLAHRPNKNQVKNVMAFDGDNEEKESANEAEGDAAGGGGVKSSKQSKAASLYSQYKGNKFGSKKGGSGAAATKVLDV